MAIKNTLLGSGCGSIYRLVHSSIRRNQVSIHSSALTGLHLSSFNCQKVKNKEKGGLNCPLKTPLFCLLTTYIIKVHQNSEVLWTHV